MPIQIRPSCTSTSIRSPGPYGGRPETNRRSRSSSNSCSDTPNSSIASSTGVPGWRTRYGTTTRRRRSRSDAFLGAVRARSDRGKRRLQPRHDLVAELRWLPRLGVRAEGEDPSGQALARLPRHPYECPAVLARADGFGGRYPLGSQPCHLGRERNHGRRLGLSRTPRPRLDVVGSAEPVRRLAPVAFVRDVGGEARQPERADLVASYVTPHDVPPSAAQHEPVRVDDPLRRVATCGTVGKPDPAERSDGLAHRRQSGVARTADRARRPRERRHDPALSAREQRTYRVLCGAI